MDIIEKLQKNEAPDEITYNAFLAKLDFDINTDYLEFIKRYNGASYMTDNIGAAGFYCGDGYINIWNIENVMALNPYDKDGPECFDWFFFGGDGSSLGYAFDKATGTVLAIELIGYEKSRIASSFTDFLEKFI